MISGTYPTCGILLIISAQLFKAGVLNAETQTLCWTVLGAAWFVERWPRRASFVPPRRDPVSASRPMTPRRSDLPSCSRPACQSRSVTVARGSVDGAAAATGQLSRQRPYRG